jgi:Flp pilus assembly protein TadB
VAFRLELRAVTAVSKERAKRRAERLTAAARTQAEAAQRERKRVDARRRRRARRAAVRRLVPRVPRGGYSRRTREQRVGTAMVIVAIGGLAWLLFDSWSVRIAVLVGTLLAAPVVATAFLGRSSR